MNGRRSLGLVSLLALTCLLALHSSAAAQAASTTTSTTTPLGGTIGSPCHPEVITVTGQAHHTLHTTVNGRGDSNRVSHINVHGEGLGQTTGTKYVFNQASNAIFNTHGTGPLEFTLVERIRVTSAGGPSEQDFVLKVDTHVIINAQGEVTVQILDFSLECN